MLEAASQVSSFTLARVYGTRDKISCNRRLGTADKQGGGLYFLQTGILEAHQMIESLISGLVSVLFAKVLDIFLEIHQRRKQ